jgi:ribosomal protein L7/L12
MESEVSVYKEVIEIIRLKPDLEALFFEIAKQYPEAIISCFKTMSRPVRGKALDKELLLIHDREDGGKIRAIKYFRDVTGCGLREAKDYVESLIDERDKEELPF